VAVAFAGVVEGGEVGDAGEEGARGGGQWVEEEVVDCCADDLVIGEVRSVSRLLNSGDGIEFRDDDEGLRDRC
jgi:hypothetical protein